MVEEPRCRRSQDGKQLFFDRNLPLQSRERVPENMNAFGGIRGVPLMLKYRVIFAFLICVWAIPASHSRAQMIHTATPFQSIGSSYSEGGSIAWSLQGNNWFANFGGAGPLLPPFGPVDPGGGIRGGLGFVGDDVSGSLRFQFGQSSHRSNVSTTPSLTLTDGVPGSISSGVLQPFVIGFTPVVGNYAMATAPLTQAENFSQQLAQSQRSALIQSQIEQQDRKLAQYLQRAERAEKEGNKRMSRANYRLAIAIAAEPLRSELRRRMMVMLSRANAE